MLDSSSSISLGSSGVFLRPEVLYETGELQFFEKQSFVGKALAGSYGGYFFEQLRRVLLEYWAHPCFEDANTVWTPTGAQADIANP